MSQHVNIDNMSGFCPIIQEIFPFCLLGGIDVKPIVGNILFFRDPWTDPGSSGDQTVRTGGRQMSGVSVDPFLGTSFKNAEISNSKF